METEFCKHLVLVHTEPLDPPPPPFGKTISSYQCLLELTPPPPPWFWYWYLVLVFPLPGKPILKNLNLWASYFIYLLMYGRTGFCKNQHFKTCIEQSATTKMTVWTVGSFHGFDLKTHLLGETLPTKSPRWISHFSSCLVIDLFLCN